MDLAQALRDFYAGERNLAVWRLLLYVYDHPERGRLSPELQRAAVTAYRQGMLDREILGTTKEDWT